VTLCESATPGVGPAVVSALGSVLGACLDQTFLRATAGSSEAVARDDVVNTVASLLEYKYQRNWAAILPGLGRLFGRAGCSSALAPLLVGLASLHDALEAAPDAAPVGTLRLVEGAVAEAVAAMGPQLFLETVPLGNDRSPVAIGRAWCLPVLRSASRTAPCSLAHFRDVILPLVAHFEGEHAALPAAQATARHGARARVVQLWSLLPAYCARPVDLAASLPSLEAPLAKAVKDPELQAVVCHALRELAGDPAAPRSDEDRAAAAGLARKTLPVLFKLLDAGAETAGQGQVLLETTSTLAKVAAGIFVGTLFKTLLQRLLEAALVSDQADAATQARSVLMCDLAIALVPVLDAASVGLLYQAIRPMVTMDDHPPFQKRCYKILHLVCDHHPAFVKEPGRLSELLGLLTASLLTCHVSSRQMRLRCLERLVMTFDASEPAHMAAIPGLLGEVVLCTKDANAKAREAAYDLLVAMAQATSDTAHFVQMVSAALAAHTPHMRSAAVLSLARLVYKLGPCDQVLRGLIPSLLSTVLVLLREQAREVVKAVVSFVRIGVAIADPAALQAVVPQVIDGLMLWAGETKNRFRATIKLIMKKLCRLYGFETMRALLPSGDQPLIAYLEKMAMRSGRKRDEAKTGRGGGAMEDDDSDDGTLGGGFGSDDDDLDDSDGGGEDDSEEEGGARGRQQQRQQQLRGLSMGGSSDVLLVDHGDGGVVVDLLDDGTLMKHTRTVHAPGAKDARGRRDDSDDEGGGGGLEVAADGRLIVPADKSHEGRTAKAEGQTKRKRDGDGAEEKAAAALLRAPPKKFKVKKAAGSEYKSKKGAGGDVLKQGKLEPYAYIPLDGKVLGSKKQHGAVEQYAGVVANSNARGAKGKAQQAARKKGKSGGKRR
jgi:ribosomal RNA-processing protein 12